MSEPDKHKMNTLPANDTRWKKGAPSPNPKGRPKKEVSLRNWLEVLANKRANGLSLKEKTLLRARVDYRDNWTNEQLICGQIIVGATQDGPHREFWVNKYLDMRVGRPVPLTDMPTIVVSQQTIVEQHQETSIDKAVGAFKALVEAGIVPAEVFQQYAVTSGNGHDESDR